jgi:hypothetical protein
VAEAAFGRTVACGYFPILYVRSPAAFLDDSIYSPPLLPRMLTKPRTVCACHLVTAMISASVAPLARFISAMTSALLLARSALGLVAVFLAGGLLYWLGLLGGRTLRFWLRRLGSRGVLF